MGAEGRLYANLPLLQQGGTKACELAETLREARNTFARATDQPGDACGYTESTKAFSTAQNAWFDELSVYIRILEDLCGGLLTATRSLGDRDQQSADDLAGLM